MKSPEVPIRRQGFTLTELLVVMGVIALLSALTALGYRTIARDAKISSGKNTVMAVLDNARALAMKNNQIVMVVFRPRVDGKEEYVEAVTAKWSGATGIAQVGFNAVIDRFVPIPGVPTRSLPVGIKVAGPMFASNYDSTWVTVTHLPAVTENGQGEAGGEMLAVMFDPSGCTTTKNSATDSHAIFVDFNNDGLQQFGNQTTGVTKLDYYSFSSSDGLPTPPVFAGALFSPSPGSVGGYVEQKFESDEPYVAVVPYLAVFDDDKAREFYDITRWSTPPSSTPGPNRMADYTEFITQNADRIHFNRYTGVAMK